MASARAGRRAARDDVWSLGVAFFFTPLPETRLGYFVAREPFRARCCTLVGRHSEHLPGAAPGVAR